MKIESSQNPKYRTLQSLLKSKGIKDEKMALASGEKITKELAALSLSSFWVTTENKALPAGQWSRTLTLSDELFESLDVCGTHAPLLCVETPTIEKIENLNPNEATLYVALSDPTNLGALVRTCAAFDWPQIVLLKEAANPFLPKAIRAASGTCFAAKFFAGPSIQDLVDPEIVALDMNGKPLSSVDIKSDLKFLVGEEGKGIPKGFSGQRWTIPISNKVESLNATIATSLLLYEWSKN